MAEELAMFVFSDTAKKIADCSREELIFIINYLASAQRSQEQRHRSEVSTMSALHKASRVGLTNILSTAFDG